MIGIGIAVVVVGFLISGIIGRYIIKRQELIVGTARERREMERRREGGWSSESVE